MTKRKRAQRAPAQENVEEMAPPVAAAFGDVSSEATEEVVPTSGTSAPRIDDAAPAEEVAPSKRKRTRRGAAKDEPAAPEPEDGSASAEPEDAKATDEIAAPPVTELEEAAPPKKKAAKTRAAKKPRGGKAAPASDASPADAPPDDDAPVPSGAVAANLLSDAMAGSDDDAPPIEGESDDEEAISDESIEESTELTFEIGADILGPDPMGDIEETINLSGDVLPLPGRDDLDEPTVAVDGGALEEIDQAATQQRHLRGLLEALIFASDTAIKVSDLAKLASASQKQVKDTLVDLRKDYSVRGIHLDEVAAGWTFRTSAQYAPFIRDLTKQKPVRLTRAQVETLAIIAYRQPITRPEIDDVRGVDSGPVLKLLLERDLVRILGKRDEVGRPIIYGTTNEFLEFFGLRSLKDLPTLREFTELTDESRETYEDEMGEPLHEPPVASLDDEDASEASSNEDASALGDGVSTSSEPPSGVEESAASSSDEDDDLDDDDDDDDLDDDDDDLDDDDDDDDDLDDDDDDDQDEVVDKAPVESQEPDDAGSRDDSADPDSEVADAEDSDADDDDEN